MAKKEQKTLALIGAGPKALAVITKAFVLKKVGFPVPSLILFEKEEVGHHWRNGSGYTNGQLPLGTSPEKDLGFPYYSFCWGDSENRMVDALMQQFSWQSFFIGKHQYADWIDRGRPAPSHHMWAEYMEWVFHKVQSEVQYINAAVKSIDIDNGRWRVQAESSEGRFFDHFSDSLVITGPGSTHLPFCIPHHPRILKTENFWKTHEDYTKEKNIQAALVGSGESSAAIAVTLGQLDPSFHVDIISPNAMTYTRGESYAENHIYTDPFQGNWLQLTEKDRRNFINRTDKGVFSFLTKRDLDRLSNVEIIPGTCRSIGIDSLNQIVLDIEYDKDREKRIYDLVVITTGFNHMDFVEKLLSENAKESILRQTKLKELSAQNVEKRIDENLAISGLQPSLHLPMMAGLNQGPGFASLSCLGRLSDHILSKYIPLHSGNKNLPELNRDLLT